MSGGGGLAVAMPRDHAGLLSSQQLLDDESDDEQNHNHPDNRNTSVRLEKFVQPPSSTKAATTTTTTTALTNVSTSCQDNEDCDTVLEQIDDCLGCVEGIDMQHQFEEGLVQKSLQHKKIAAAHGLSEAEAAMIRRQITSSSNSGRTGTVSQLMETATLPTDFPLDMLHQLCSSPTTSATNSTLEPSEFTLGGGGGGGCGAGVVSPTDTTLHYPTDGFLAPDHSTRSLMDVVAILDEDPSQNAAKDGSNSGVGAEMSLPPLEECAICFDKASGTAAGKINVGDHCSSSSPSSTNRIRFVHFPCCDPANRHSGEGDDDDSSCQESLSSSSRKEGVSSSMNVCISCILVLTTATSDGLSRVGRCPCCRTWIIASTLHSPHTGLLTLQPLNDGSSSSSSPAATSGHCSTCNQDKAILIEQDPPTCDACFLGQRTTSLLYECQDCHSIQAIPHPMYRYQSTSDTFGSVPRACPSGGGGGGGGGGKDNNEGCGGKLTHWRICKDQLAWIPAGDVPEAWGDDGLTLARAKVQVARQGIARLDLAAAAAAAAASSSLSLHQETDEQCCIL